MRGEFVIITSLQESGGARKGIDGITELILDQNLNSNLLFFTSPSSMLGLKVEMRLSEIITKKGLPIKITKIDVTKDPEAAENYNIVATPTLIFRNLRACGHYELDELEEILEVYLS
ncbi:MAG: hypothetical protein ACFFCD_14200 [Promethearchaeota archaeon]